MLAVTGNPVYHSLSPELFRILGQNYSRIAAKNDSDILEIVREHKLKGFNVTSPFKKSLAEFFHNSKTFSPSNLKHKLINTVVLSESSVQTYNTDYFAVKEFLNNYKYKNLLLLGAGDVAEIILTACKENEINVSVYNRTQSKPDTLARDFPISVISKNHITKAIQKSDIIFNISPEWEEVVYDAIKINKTENQIFADAIYTKSPFAQLNITPDFSGKDWLISQAKKAYEKFESSEVPDLNNFENLTDRLIRNKPDNYILIGFMGAGKTTIGKLLAKKIGYSFIDTDEIIEEKTKLKISVLFEKYGEEYFRAIESEVINDLNVKNHIIAMGGGAIIRNSEKMKSYGELIYLYSDLDVCMDRVKYSDRPLKYRINIKDFYNERKMLYFRNSDLVINSGFDEDEVADRLFREINYAFGSKR